MCINVYTYTCVHVYVHMCTRVHMCIHMCTRVYTRIFRLLIRTHMCTHVYTRVHMCTHVYTHVYTWICVHVYTHVYVYECVHNTYTNGFFSKFFRILSKKCFSVFINYFYMFFRGLKKLSFVYTYTYTRVCTHHLCTRTIPWSKLSFISPDPKIELSKNLKMWKK